MIDKEKEYIMCVSCRYWKNDQDYTHLGYCNNSAVKERIIFGHADMLLFTEDFGCIYAKALNNNQNPGD